jgi:hypothetical protein
VITIFRPGLSGQLSLEFLFLVEEDYVELGYFFHFILENLSLCHVLIATFRN